MENLMYYGCQGIITAAETAVKRGWGIAHNLADYSAVSADIEQKMADLCHNATKIWLISLY